MQDLLADIYKKHLIWIDIVKSFGCNKDTSEDLVMEIYIKLKKSLDNGLDIKYGDDDYNYFYVYKTLKSLFLDLKRKESKINVISIDFIVETNPNFNIYKKMEKQINYSKEYNSVLNELDKIHWYDKKVYQLIDDGLSVAELSRKTKIPYHSLYNTYRMVITKLKNIL